MNRREFTKLAAGCSLAFITPYITHAKEKINLDEKILTLPNTELHYITIDNTSKLECQNKQTHIIGGAAKVRLHDGTKIWYIPMYYIESEDVFYEQILANMKACQEDAGENPINTYVFRSTKSSLLCGVMSSSEKYVIVHE